MQVVDLFSGLGGFSQAFLQRGHDVERYDLDPKFKGIPNTFTIDVLDLEPEDIEHADIILASPPCQHFSPARAWETWPRGFPSDHIKPSIRLVKHTVSIIKDAKPRYWILENPVGMLRNVLGKPAHTAYWAAYGAPFKKPTHLWGILPPFDRKMPFKWEKAPQGSKGGIQSGSRSPAERALIPYGFSLAICLAAEGLSPQTTLLDFNTD